MDTATQAGPDLAAAVTPTPKKPAPAVRRRRRVPLLQRPRKGALKVHTWLGLVLGLWVALQCLTGGILAFADQLDAWSRPELFRHTAGDLGAQRAVEAARPLVPGARAASVSTPASQTGVYVVTMSFPPPPGQPAFLKGKPTSPQRLVYVDPGSGEVNGVRDPSRGFVAKTRQFHGDLWLADRKVLGISGEHLVGALGVGFILVLLTGAYAWLWPAARRWFRSLTVRRGNALRTNVDLHRAAGFLAFPVLLLIAVTGLNFTFHDQFRSVWYAVTPGADVGPRTAIPSAPSVVPAAGAAPVAVDVALRAAADATGGTVRGASLPFAPNGSYVVRVSKGWDPAAGPRGRGGNLVVSVDQYSGSALRVARPSDLNASARGYEDWVFPLHAGTPFQTPGRVLYVVVALLSVGLVATGTAGFVLRRRAKARRGKVIRQAMVQMPVEVVAAAEEHAEEQRVTAGTVVVRQGEPASAFYVIASGALDVSVHQDGGQLVVAHLSAGQCFGEIGVLHTGVRTATVTATEDCELVVLDEVQLRRVVADAIVAGADLQTAAAGFASALTSSTVVAESPELPVQAAPVEPAPSLEV
jgi:uncharacterized iron-regulated membrane protein